MEPLANLGCNRNLFRVAWSLRFIFFLFVHCKTHFRAFSASTGFKSVRMSSSPVAPLGRALELNPASDLWRGRCPLTGASLWKRGTSGVWSSLPWQHVTHRTIKHFCIYKNISSEVLYAGCKTGSVWRGAYDNKNYFKKNTHVSQMCVCTSSCYGCLLAGNPSALPAALCWW